MLFIYVLQHTDFSHYSLSQAFVVLVVITNKSTLSHPKLMLPIFELWAFPFA